MKRFSEYPVKEQVRYINYWGSRYNHEGYCWRERIRTKIRKEIRVKLDEKPINQIVFSHTVPALERFTRPMALYGIWQRKRFPWKYHTKASFRLLVRRVLDLDAVDRFDQV